MLYDVECNDNKPFDELLFYPNEAYNYMRARKKFNNSKNSQRIMDHDSKSEAFKRFSY